MFNYIFRKKQRVFCIKKDNKTAKNQFLQNKYKFTKIKQIYSDINKEKAYGEALDMQQSVYFMNRKMSNLKR